jgi:hypothetical protein
VTAPGPPESAARRAIVAALAEAGLTGPDGTYISYAGLGGLVHPYGAEPWRDGGDWLGGRHAGDGTPCGHGVPPAQTAAPPPPGGYTCGAGRAWLPGREPGPPAAPAGRAWPFIASSWVALAGAAGAVAAGWPDGGLSYSWAAVTLATFGLWLAWAIPPRRRAGWMWHLALGATGVWVLAGVLWAVTELYP